MRWKARKKIQRQRNDRVDLLSQPLQAFSGGDCGICANSQPDRVVQGPLCYNYKQNDTITQDLHHAAPHNGHISYAFIFHYYHYFIGCCPPCYLFLSRLSYSSSLVSLLSVNLTLFFLILVPLSLFYFVFYNGFFFKYQMITLDFFIDYNVALCLFGNIIFWLFDTNTWISLKNIYI